MKRRAPVSVGLVFSVLAGAGQVAYGEAGSIFGCGSQVVLPQEELTDPVAVAAGCWHSLGLKAYGSIVAWGCRDSFNSGQCDVLVPNPDFTAIAAGICHSLGLKRVFGDVNVDDRVDLADFDAFADCLSGPGVLPPRGCDLSRMDGDWNVDLADLAILQRTFSALPGQ